MRLISWIGRAAVPWGVGFAAIATGVGGCGNGADGVGSCRQIEEARCRRAPSCSISLEPPYHTSGGDVDACIRFYDIACLHGLDVAEPSNATVDLCVSAIETSPLCTIVSNPASDPRCGWLAPAVTPVVTVDASTEDAATVLDATTE
jgi:hypothetical protein